MGVLKARAGFAPADYKREDYQIERLHRNAVDAGLTLYRRNVPRIRGDRAKRRHKRIAENGGDPGVLDVSPDLSVFGKNKYFGACRALH